MRKAVKLCTECKNPCTWIDTPEEEITCRSCSQNLLEKKSGVGKEYLWIHIATKKAYKVDLLGKVKVNGKWEIKVDYSPIVYNGDCWDYTRVAKEFKEKFLLTDIRVEGRAVDNEQY